MFCHVLAGSNCCSSRNSISRTEATASVTWKRIRHQKCGFERTSRQRRQRVEMCVCVVAERLKASFSAAAILSFLGNRHARSVYGIMFAASYDCRLSAQILHLIYGSCPVVDAGRSMWGQENADGDDLDPFLCGRGNTDIFKIS